MFQGENRRAQDARIVAQLGPADRDLVVGIDEDLLAGGGPDEVDKRVAQRLGDAAADDDNVGGRAG